MIVKEVIEYLTSLPQDKQLIFQSTSDFYELARVSEMIDCPTCGEHPVVVIQLDEIEYAEEG